MVAGWADASGSRVYVGLPPGGGPVAGAQTTLPVLAEDLAVADFDGDGSADLAVGGGAEVTVWLGPLPAGTLTLADAAARYVGPMYPDDGLGSALAAADTDGDGRAELAIGAPLDGDGDVPAYIPPGRVWWLTGAGL